MFVDVESEETILLNEASLKQKYYRIKLSRIEEVSYIVQDDSTSNDAIKSAIPRRQHFRLKATTTRNSDAPTYITQLRICNCTPYLIIRNESLKFTSLSQFSKLYCVCNVAKHHPLVFKPTSNSS